MRNLGEEAQDSRLKNYPLQLQSTNAQSGGSDLSGRNQCNEDRITMLGLWPKAFDGRVTLYRANQHGPGGYGTAF